MTIAIVLSLTAYTGAVAYVGYKYGHSVASKAAAEAAKVQRAVKDLK